MGEKIAKKGPGGKRAGAGRPKKLLDPAVAEQMGAALPSARDLGFALGVDEKTVTARLEDQPEFAEALARGGARTRIRLSATGLEQAMGFFVCAACNRVLREPDPTPADPANVKACPDHPPEYFGTYSGGAKDGKQVPWRKWRAGNPISFIFNSKQHLGYRDRSFIEEEFQRDMSKIPEGRLLDLVLEALRVLGKTLPAELVDELKKGSQP